MDRFYLEWERGTQLAAAYCMQGDPVDVFYEYDANGLRTRKTVDNINTIYLYIGSTLVRQVTGNETLCFSYGADGAPLGFTYNGTPYYYVTNLQGDVVAITDATGTIVVQYTYDSWGKLLMTSGTLASTIGKANPLRYRGYYYDNETELYYLQSRYYDPCLGRFISPDSLLVAGNYLTGLNRYAYCNCNPVMYSDPTGREISNGIGSTILKAFGDLFMIVSGVPFSDQFIITANCYSAADYLYIALIIYEGKNKRRKSFSVCRSFQDKEICTIVARYYTWVPETYSEDRIAMEIYAHTFVYYASGEDLYALKQLIGYDIENGALLCRLIDYIRGRADPIDIGRDPFPQEAFTKLYSYIWEKY